MSNKKVYPERTKVIELDVYNEEQKIVLLQVMVMAKTCGKPIAELTGLFGMIKPLITHPDFWKAYKEFTAAGEEFGSKVEKMIDLKKKQAI